MQEEAAVLTGLRRAREELGRAHEGLLALGWQRKARTVALLLASLSLLEEGVQRRGVLGRMGELGEEAEG